MKRRRRESGMWQIDLVDRSPLRAVDPRTKLALSLAASLAVMLPVTQLAVAILAYIAFMGWARVLKGAARQVWRLKWVLLGLFVIDWLFVSPDLAISITLRLSLLASTFSMFFATTTPAELRLALEWLRVPYRYAFSLSLAFQSLGLLDQEWRSIREAQQARGAWQPPTGWRRLRQNVQDMIALSVPAIVLATKRAWSMTEAAYARGFDSPHRRPYRHLRLVTLDWVLVIGSTLIGAGLIVWRFL